MKGNTRNRWRDGPVCPAADKELWRLGPDSSGQGKKKTGKKPGERVREKRPGEREEEKTEKNLEREREKRPGEREREKDRRKDKIPERE
ncbi:hypothetical protein TNCV_881311 [Trichonephila clavipes]|nr:hypothetical protein TNCV_881311 [Trichonephila clavipes]